MFSSLISDAHNGLVRAIQEVFPVSAWQRCIAHFERNVAERCRKKGTGEAVVAALKKTLAESEEPALVRARYRKSTELLAVVDEWGASLSKKQSLQRLRT